MGAGGGRRRGVDTLIRRRHLFAVDRSYNFLTSLYELNGVAFYYLRSLASEIYLKRDGSEWMRGGVGERMEEGGGGGGEGRIGRALVPPNATPFPWRKLEL